jgi:hypothetical protein
MKLGFEEERLCLDGVPYPLLSTESPILFSKLPTHVNIAQTGSIL